MKKYFVQVKGFKYNLPSNGRQLHYGECYHYDPVYWIPKLKETNGRTGLMRICANYWCHVESLDKDSEDCKYFGSFPRMVHHESQQNVNPFSSKKEAQNAIDKHGFKNIEYEILEYKS